MPTAVAAAKIILVYVFSLSVARIFLNGVHGQSLPKIFCDSTVKVINVGSTVQFACTVRDGKDFPIQWLRESQADGSKHGDIPLAVGNMIIARDQRMSVKYVDTSYVFRLEDVRPSDAGNYRCEIVVSVGVKISVGLELRVLYAPNIYNESRTLSVAAGQFIDLECYADGYPPPIVYWKRRDGASLPTGGLIYPGNVLNLANFSQTLVGTYVCIADNTVEPNSIRDITLYMQNIRTAK